MISVSASVRFLPLVWLVLLIGCRTTAPTAMIDDEPRFDWFRYTGDDPVYRSIERPEDHYLNPILAGFYPDPSITRGNDAWYLVTSSFAWFPGIPIFRSVDLVNWVQVGHVLDRPGQLPLEGLEISEGVFAPTIRYHEGTYYVVNTLVGAGGNFVVTATDPAGPWSDPVWLPSVDGIDPDIFFDDDGRAYISNNGPPEGPPLYDGHRALWIQEFDPDAMEMIGPRKMIVDGGVDISTEPIWIEAPHIFKVDGLYYLIAAEGGTGEGHSEVVFRSDDVWGPWVPYEDNPILTQRHLPENRPVPVTSAGHADMTQTPDGSWWAVFLATRPYEDNFYNIGRETFLLPVEWRDGWPVILDRDETVPYVVQRPDLTTPSESVMPTAGNFTIQDDFEGDKLGFPWNFIRTPRAVSHSLSSTPGWLTLTPKSVRIGERGQPTFVGRRQQHSFYTAETRMQYRPARTGDHAGIVAFQNDDYYYFFGLEKQDDGIVAVVERSAGADRRAERIAIRPWTAADDAYLRVTGRGAAIDFHISQNGRDWQPVATDQDATILSTRRAGGFVGTYLGLYAYRSP